MTDQHEPELREQLAQLLAFFRRALRHWLMPVVTLALAALACGAFFRVRKPKYRSETVILYVEKGGMGDGAEPESASRTVSMRLKELLFSRATLDRVVDAFGLYPELRKQFGDVDAVEELRKHIEFRAPGGDTISIAFEGASPGEVQRVTAELARSVIDGDSTLRKQQAELSLTFLAGEKKSADAELRANEEALAAFMAQHPRFALDATPLANGAAIRATMGGAAAAQPRPELSRALTVPQLAAVSSVPLQVAAGPSAQTLDAKAAEGRALAAVAAARENLNKQLAQYTPAHPDVRAAQADLARATERLAAIEANGPAALTAPPVAAPAGTEPAVAAAPVPRRVWSAPAPAPAHSADTKELVALETQWLKLTQAVTEAHERQDQIEGQWFKADIQASSESAGHGAQVSVIDPAYLPEREQPPGRSVIAALFAGGGLVLGVIGALLAALFDDRVFGARDFVGKTPLLVEIPAFASERRRRDAV